MKTLSTALGTPPKVVLVNVETTERMPCLANPTQLVEKVQVNWSRIAVPGLPHQVLSYSGTSNRQLPSVEFYVDKVYAAELAGDDADIHSFRAFLRALTVPAEGLEAPSRVLVIWPNVLTLEAVVAEVEFQYKQFAIDSSVLVYSATVTFEEILDRRITAAERREHGIDV